MTLHGVCTACSKEKTNDRYFGSTYICDCGWVESRAQKVVEKSQHKRIIGFMGALLFVVFILFTHMVNWGSDAFSILFLQASHKVGAISISSLESLIGACERHDKWQCVEDGYLTMFQKDPKNLDALNKLAKFHIRLKDYQKATLSYQRYFESGGNDPRAMYHYAKSLEETNQIDQAAEWYEKSINQTDATVLPVNATRGLFGLLVRAQDYEKARKVLNRFHEMGGDAKTYMAQELDEFCVRRTSDRLCLVAVN